MVSKGIVVCLITIFVCSWAIPLQIKKTQAVGVFTEQNSHRDVKDYNKSRYANVKLGQLNISVIKPPDHLEGLPMERDGQLNPQYRKEVLLGTQASVQNEDDALLRSVFEK